jgi:hypothetical protein
LFALLVGRPDLTAMRHQPRRMLMNFLPVVYGLAGAAAVLATLLGLASWLFGSADAALARIRGERISLYPRLVDVGTGAPGELREAAFEVINRTDHPIHLIGAARD